MPTYIPNNEIMLCENVGIIKGKHQRYFESEVDQLTYFQERSVHRSDDYSYIKDDKAIRLNINLESLRDVNYLVFRNEDFGGRYIFAFIIDLVYKSEMTTYVYYEVDTFQTRLFDIQWKPSYIEREHCRLYKTDGTPVINTIEEGLDYGSEYQVVSNYNYTMFNNVFFAVITSSVRLEKSVESDEYQGGSINATETPLNYYIVPMRKTSNGIVTMSVGDGTPLGLSELFTMLQSERYNDTIVSITITPFLPFTFNYDVNSPNTITSSDLIYHVKSDGVKVWKPKDITIYKTFDLNFSGSKYTPFAEETESKLLMFPYSFAEISDYSGHQMELRLEHLNTSGITFRVWSSVNHQSKWAVGVKGLNTSGTFADINQSLINNTIHDVPIKSDMLASFLQSNRNAVTMTNISSGLQIMQGIGQTTAGVGMMLGSVATATSGSGVGGVGGIGQGVGNIANGLLQVMNTQAKLRDIDNVPPSINSMGNNTQFEYGNDFIGFRLTFKQIKPEYKQKISSIFKMYGYKVHEVKLPNLHTRRHFNFIKTIDCTIQGSMSLPEINELRTMFNNGITLWHTNDIGNYSLGNEVIV